MFVVRIIVVLHCQRFKKIKEMDTTCCAFGDDSCTGYYPPFEFDEIYYQCPQCLESANITTCICQTRFDDAANLGQTNSVPTVHFYHLMMVVF